MARPSARGLIRQHNIPIVEPSATSAFVAPISAWSAPQVAKSVGEIGTLTARRHTMPNASGQKRDTKNRLRSERRGMATTKPNRRRGDPEASDECRHSARISENPPLIMAETRLVGWGARIRTWEWRNQNPLPYHLATPQYALTRARGTIAAARQAINARACRVPAATL